MTALKGVLAALAAVAVATRADAQFQPQPQAIPGGTFRPTPKVPPAFPSVNSWPGIPAYQINPPLYNPGPLFNPALNNPYLNQTQVIPYNPLVNPWGAPLTTYTPPLAVQQPGLLLWRGPDLQVNPVSGTVYRPLSGVAQTRNGSTFYRVAGSGLPTFTGAYAPGTGLYFDPQSNTFLNPGTGVISRPGTTNVFVPWIPPGTRW